MTGWSASVWGSNALLLLDNLLLSLLLGVHMRAKRVYVCMCGVCACAHVCVAI